MCDIHEGDNPAWDEAGREFEEIRLKQLAEHAAQTEVVNPEWVSWLGPCDGLSGEFCGALVGRAIPYRYAKRMLNPRGRPVLEDAGGFRCRCSISATSASLIKALGIPTITDAEVEEVTRVAGRIRRQRELRGLK